MLNNVTVSKFILNGGNVALEMAGTAITGKYVRGINLIRSEIASVTNWYNYNAHGDVVQLTNASGNVTRTYDYNAFGVQRNPDHNDTNPFKYYGEYYDVEKNTYCRR